MDGPNNSGFTVPMVDWQVAVTCISQRQLDNRSCPIIIKIANAPKTNPTKGINFIGIVIYQYNNEIATSILLVTILCQSSLDQYTMELHFSLVDCGQTL